MGSKSSRPGSQQVTLGYHQPIIWIARLCASRNRETAFSVHTEGEDSGEALLDLIAHTIDEPLDNSCPGPNPLPLTENAVTFSEIL